MGCIGVILYDVAVTLMCLTVARSIATYRVFSELARDAALLGLGYDSLCRSVELCRVKVEHLDLGLGTI